MKKSILYSILALVLLIPACNSVRNNPNESMQANISAYWECVSARSSTNTSAPFVDFNLLGEHPVINGSSYDSWEVRGNKLSIGIANRPDASFSILTAEEDQLKIVSDISGVTYTLTRRLISASVTHP